MAELIIPPPDNAGYWHFTYVTTDPVDGRWYGGKRSTRKHPMTDPYRGSGNWVRAHSDRKRLVRRIVAFFPSSAEVFAAEAELVTWFDVWNNTFCMNERPGGDGMSIETARIISADEAIRAKKSAAAFRREANAVFRSDKLIRMRILAADPEWQKAHATRLHHIHTNPEIRAKVAAGTRRTGPDPAVRAKKRAAAFRREADPEYQAKRNAAMKRRGENGEWRAKQSPAAFLREARKRAAKALLMTAGALAKKPGHFQPCLEFALAASAVGSGVCANQPHGQQRSKIVRPVATSPFSQAQLWPDPD
jgi:hypothetical protein